MEIRQHLVGTVQSWVPLLSDADLMALHDAMADKLVKEPGDTYTAPVKKAVAEKKTKKAASKKTKKSTKKTKKKSTTKRTSIDDGVVLTFVKQQKAVSRKEVSEGLKLSPSQASSSLKRLTEAGKIHKAGDRRFTRYGVSAKAARDRNKADRSG